MKLEKSYNTTVVTLSRRNLLTLLAKLDREGSRRTLVTGSLADGYLAVTAEEDNVHYAGRSPGMVLDAPKEGS